MPETEKVTREELEWLESMPVRESCFLIRQVGESARLANICDKAGIGYFRSAPDILLAVRAAYARQHEPTKAERELNCHLARQIVRDWEGFFRDNVPGYGARVSRPFAPKDGDPVRITLQNGETITRTYRGDGPPLPSPESVPVPTWKSKPTPEETVRTKAALASAVTLKDARVIAVHCDAGRIWADIAVGGLVTRVKGGAK